MDLRKVCPRCGMVSDKRQTACPGCKESLLLIEPEDMEFRDSRDDNGSGARPNGAETGFGDQLLTMRPPGPWLHCSSQPEFVFLVKDGSTIGRKGTINVCPLADSRYIGRVHARFRSSNGRWYLKNLNKNSFTCVNGREVEPDAEQPIVDGDHITLGTTCFVFRAK